MIVAVVVAFSYGLGVGVYRWPPFDMLLAARHLVTDAVDPPADEQYERQAELLRDVFQGPLTPQQMDTPSKTMSDVARRVDEYFVEVSRVRTAFQELVLRSDHRSGDRFSVAYELGRSYDAHAFALDARASSPGARRCAALIIPGTGDNQATEIVKRTPSNYHGAVADVTTRHCDTYVQVKPNQDYNAIHDGQHKLAFVAVYNHLLTRGGSYSARYLVDSLALSKWLKREYGTLVLLGLSQGGQAVLINALQSEPTGAVVSSGYTVLNSQLTIATADQIVLPGELADFDEQLPERIRAMSTQFMFTYGRRETGAYRVEAEDGDTCRILRETEKVTCLVHDGGHVFPLPAVERFIEDQIGRSEARQQ